MPNPLQQRNRAKQEYHRARYVGDRGRVRNKDAKTVADAMNKHKLMMGADGLPKLSIEMGLTRAEAIVKTIAIDETMQHFLYESLSTAVSSAHLMQ